MQRQPLGLIRQVTPEILERIAMIEATDFSGPRSRMCVDFPTDAETLDRVEFEVKRFLALALIADKSHKVVIGEKIDTLWHYQILHTREYREFCKRVFGGYLNHVPILPSEKASLGPDYDKTRQLYASCFGPPPAELWADENQICWGGCDEYVGEEDPHESSRRVLAH